MIYWKKITLSSFGTTHTTRVYFSFLFPLSFPLLSLGSARPSLFLLLSSLLSSFSITLLPSLFYLNAERERDKRVRSGDGEGDQRERVGSREMKLREPRDETEIERVEGDGARFSMDRRR
jgi:hypothetical protein